MSYNLHQIHVYNVMEQNNIGIMIYVKILLLLIVTTLVPKWLIVQLVKLIMLVLMNMLVIPVIIYGL